ncbi:phosphoenolpyruvate-protein phosphotransferase [Actinoplanes sp. SE50]|uniref:dihydroxyacetone kinase phosphoryl donor subunit DhaM n=1 Tax=unclassified Actinoplanes TaxID=2626549 RepID=UPI00023EC320|nr:MULTISPECIES: dihydroxyacetone kinase phosphoryl donor subunit DhaM [unclassified Actinoplanes]AEV86378.1 PTS-dependent dihydroxyacetone kinase, phosphotransferase subunit dhaM [Actinoplanes sp. SE50/110]ATO84775.1 phosphoenolpyruvate-protein phosphotransferase [Actinoplanes sp. SE50]SLM02185.1 PTS-dependent dihydroxyacetone kinase, phosphotransferase [Actinoplanes sp. SE50/110]
MGLVGIVLVSHSEQLASGLRDLLRQVAGDEVRIEPAAGTDDGDLGTSPDRLSAAIAAADTGAGVVILADLGSAVLTARAVLADTPGPLLVDAPFVEGAMAAAVTASTGAGPAAVAEAAREARDVAKF